MWSRTEPPRSPERAEGVDVLMYHSVSDEPGPTSIPVATFTDQMTALSECGCRVVSLTELLEWGRGERSLHPRTVMITFDDGFRDFAEAAYPVLRAHGFPATVFLPTACMGSHESWYGANRDRRSLMSWAAVQDLAREGVEFGGHSETHADLTTLLPTDLTREIRASQDAIAERLGRPTRTFAPPYGRVNAAVLTELSKWTEVSVGTALGRVTRPFNVLDAPRIEMHYFRDPRIWRSYLSGRGEAYLRLRRAARSVRRIVSVLLEQGLPPLREGLRR